MMELKEARLIAEETLRVIATHPDAYDFRDFVGRELDISDEILLEALTTIEKAG